jgi:hypothetical protein
MALVDIGSKTYRWTFNSGHTAEIGDARSTSFKTHLKFKKWLGECSVGFTFPGINSMNPVIVGDVITAENNNYKFEWSPCAENNGFNDEGGYDWKITLKKKPGSANSWAMSYDTTNVTAFFQPPLTPQEVAAGHIRPDHVVNSIAFYHTSKTDNGYKTGKVAHLYRMWCTDSSATPKTTWADWSLSGTRMILTVNATYLATATYPVVIAPVGDTLGYTTAGGSSADWTTAGTIVMTKPYTAGADGTVQSISIYVRGNDGVGTNFKGLLATHADHTLVANGISAPANANWGDSPSPNWYVLTFGTDPSISNGTAYIMGYVQDAAFSRIYYDNGDAGYHYDETNSYASPDTSGVAAGSNFNMSIYATYTADAGSTDYPITCTASLTCAASVVRTRTVTRATTSNLSVAVSLLKGWGRTKAVNAGLTVAAAVTRTRTINRAVSAGLTVGAAVAKSVAWNKAVSAGLSVGAAVNAARSKIITIIANLTASATVVRTLTYTRATTSDLTAAASLLKGWGRTKVVNAGLTVAASVTRTRAITRATVASLTASAVVVRARAITRATTASITVAANSVATVLETFKDIAWVILSDPWHLTRTIKIRRKQ